MSIDAWNKRLFAQIEQARGRNNKHWMALMKLAVKAAPKEAAVILEKIREEDKKISRFMSGIIPTTKLKK